MSGDLAERLRRQRERCERVGQAHVLRHADELSPEALARFLEQLESVDLERVGRLFESVRTPAAAAEAPPEPCELIELGEG